MQPGRPPSGGSRARPRPRGSAARSSAARPGPIVTGGTKCAVADVEVEDPAPGREECVDLLAEAPEVGRVERRLDLATVPDPARPSSCADPTRSACVRRATKNPLVPCTCGSVCRNSGRRGWRNAATRPRVRRRSPARPPRRGVDDGLRLVGVDRADGVDDRAARPHARRPRRAGARAGARAAAPRASAGRAARRAHRAPSRARRRARGRSRSAPAGASRPSAWTTRDVGRPEPPDVLLELPRARLVRPRPRRPRRRASSPCRPGAAQRSSTRSPARAPTASPASCEPALCGQMRPSASASSSTRSTRHAPGTSDRARPRSRRGRAARRSAAPRSGPASARARRPAPRSRHHVSATQSGYECRSAASCQVASGSASTCARPLVGEAPEHGVRERDGALEPRPADELHRLVHGRVARHAVEERELEGPEPERRAHRRVEPARPGGGRSPRSRGRASAPAARCRTRAAGRAPGRARRASPRPRAARGRRTPRPRRRGSTTSKAATPRGRDLAPRSPEAAQPRRRSPSACRRRAAPRAARSRRPPPRRARQTVTRRPCSSARAPMCGDSARTRRTSSSAGRSRSSSRSAGPILSAYVTPSSLCGTNSGRRARASTSSSRSAATPAARANTAPASSSGRSGTPPAPRPAPRRAPSRCGGS